MNQYYITTPIYYVNDRPHIGHCYTTVVADVAARFQRMVRGHDADVFFLTGTDEHADKVVTSAAENKVTPQEWADRNAAEFRRAFGACNVSFNDFIRTTESRHKDRVIEYITSLLKSGDIYRGQYTGWYDQGQEEYVTENAAREADFKSTISGKPLVKRTEDCYFFKLSKYQDALQKHIETHPAFVSPSSRQAEILGRIRAGLNDVPISRPVTSDPATQWGIRVPGDDANRVYVWIDALFNYLSVVDAPERRTFWPAAVHLIGKDILWFHAAIWPALLMALRASSPAYDWVKLPHTIFGHGWWISEGMKMSKSLGNFISFERLMGYADRYSLDAVRWFLATQGPLSGADADFAHAKFIETYNAELANGLGNCTSRVSNMIDKYFGGVVPENAHDGEFAPQPGGGSPIDLALAARAAAKNPAPAGAEGRAFHFPETIAFHVKRAIEDQAAFDMSASLMHVTEIVRFVDDFISHTAPFTLAKTMNANPDAKPALAAILFACAEALRVASLLASPAMPTKMAHLWRDWNCAPAAGVALVELARYAGDHSLKAGQKIVKGEPLFMRADPAEAPPAERA